jgi:long-chain acyl-CoA synthetase
MSLWSELERSMVKHASQPAITGSDGQCLDYGHLLQEVNRSSDRLRTIIPADSRVAVYDLHPSREAVHILSLIQIGVTLIPLALKYGEQRCKQIIEHTKPDFLYTGSASQVTQQLIEACQAVGTVILVGGERLNVDQNQHKVHGLFQGHLQEPQTYSEQQSLPPSFIMYTSGSTGKPKGAVLTYANIAANIKDIRTYFDISPGDHILINRSLSHVSVMTGEFLYGIICGARITFNNEPFVPRRLLSFIESNGITVFCSTPTIFYQLTLDRSEYRLPEMRKVALMGEYLHRQVALKIQERFPQVEFYMLYGQTEASPRITYLPPAYFTTKEGSIGIPLPSMEIRVNNEEGLPASEGESGELLVKGPNIFLGYWDQPELTAVKLQSGWLHTGDMVAQGEDGFLYISGRKDDMMIRAGMNIYPKEIEDVLLEDERIREVVVFGVADPKFGQKIHVTVVHHPDQTVTQADILDICKSKLASYQYPDKVDIVQDIPRNSAGKIMRRQII